MPAPYSADLRRRVIAAVDDSGYSRRQAAALFRVSESTAVKWLRDWYAEGRDRARAMGAAKGSKLDAHADVLLAMIDAEPDLTLQQVQGRLAERGVRVGLTAIWRFFKQHERTLKKRRRTPASSSARTSPRRARPGRRSSRVSIPPTSCSWTNAVS